jgi:hypothetical protein
MSYYSDDGFDHPQLHEEDYMAICVKCGRKYRMNWVRMQPCPTCRRRGEVGVSTRTKVELLGDWTDDHILCCAVRINGEKIELWWCGWEGLAAAKYANESPQAMKDLIQFVDNQKELDKEAKEHDELDPEVD